MVSHAQCRWNAETSKCRPDQIIDQLVGYDVGLPSQQCNNANVNKIAMSAFWQRTEYECRPGA
jgi:hypothetical protein